MGSGNIGVYMKMKGVFTGLNIIMVMKIIIILIIILILFMFFPPLLYGASEWVSKLFR